MDDEFTVHDFIQRLAQRHQHEYIRALASYLKPGDEPFRIVHGEIGKRLEANYKDRLEKIGVNTPSYDIFGDSAGISKFRKRVRG